MSDTTQGVYKVKRIVSYNTSMQTTEHKDIKMTSVVIRNELESMGRGDVKPITAFRHIRDLCDKMLEKLEIERRKVTGNHK